VTHKTPTVNAMEKYTTEHCFFGSDISIVRVTAVIKPKPREARGAHSPQTIGQIREYLAVHSPDYPRQVGDIEFCGTDQADWRPAKSVDQAIVALITEDTKQ